MAFWMVNDKKGKLKESDINQIILKACLPKYEKQIVKAQFFKNIYIRQSEIDNLYELYSKDMKLRTIINNYLIDQININKLIEKDMNQAIDSKECFIYFLSGIPGSGKSWFAIYTGYLYQLLMLKKNKKLKVCWWLNPDEKTPSLIFNEHKNKEQENLDIHVSYSNSQTTELFQNVKDGTLIIQDESPTQHGKGSRIMKDNLQNLIKIAARRNTINLIIINPTIFTLDNVNYYLRVLGKNKELKNTTAMVLNSKLTPVGIINYIVELPPELTSSYEANSKLQKKKIQGSAGQSSASISEEELERLSDILVERTRKFHISKAKEFQEYAALVPEVAGHLYLNLICHRAVNKISQSVSPVESESVPENIVHTPFISNELTVEGFRMYAINQVNQCRSSDINEIDKLIFQNWINGMTLGEIAMIREINLQPPQLSKRMRKFREGNSQSGIISVGKLFQQFCTIVISGNVSNLAVYDNNPDLIFNDIIYTIKFIAERQTVYFNFYEDFGPEIQNQKETHRPVHLLYFNQSADVDEPAILDVLIDTDKYSKMAISLKNSIMFYKN